MILQAYKVIYKQKAKQTCDRDIFIGTWNEIF